MNTETVIDPTLYNPDPGMMKVVEVDHPERMLDATTKTAMMTVATWADHFRVDESWRDLHRFRFWRHGRRVHEVSHFGEYTTMQGDVLVVCPVASDDVICQVQVTEIRMVDCQDLSSDEVRELGFPDRETYDAQWRDTNEDAPKGWFMRVILLEDTNPTLQ